MLKRDVVSGGIVSYTDDSGIQNEGVLDVAVLDGRFLRRDFSRIIDTNFKSLKEATSAEANINKKIRSIQNRALIPGEFAKITGQEPSTTLSDAEKAELAKKEFLTNISNLISTDGNTVTGMQYQMNQMQEQLATKDSIISQQIQTISKFDDVLSSVSAERALAVAKAERLREANVSLQRQADEKLARIQNEVVAQRKQAEQSAKDLKTALVDNISATNTKQDVDIEQLKLQNLQLQQNLQDTNTAISDTKQSIIDLQNSVIDAANNSDTNDSGANGSTPPPNEPTTDSNILASLGLQESDVSYGNDANGNRVMNVFKGVTVKPEAIKNGALPVKFGVVNGPFDCSGVGLTTLAGAPSKCSEFNCSNNSLTSLQGSPQIVDGGIVNCSKNKLQNLEGGPQTGAFTKLQGDVADAKRNTFYKYDCSFNLLNTLRGYPQTASDLGGTTDVTVIMADFNCSNNQYLFVLEGVTATPEKQPMNIFNASNCILTDETWARSDVRWQTLEFNGTNQLSGKKLDAAKVRQYTKALTVTV
jgi:hypothetical protein